MLILIVKPRRYLKNLILALYTFPTLATVSVCDSNFCSLKKSATALSAISTPTTV